MLATKNVRITALKQESKLPLHLLYQDALGFLGQLSGFSFSPARNLQIANPTIAFSVEDGETFKSPFRSVHSKARTDCLKIGSFCSSSVMALAEVVRLEAGASDTIMETSGSSKPRSSLRRQKNTVSEAKFKSRFSGEYKKSNSGNCRKDVRSSAKIAPISSSVARRIEILERRLLDAMAT